MNRFDFSWGDTRGLREITLSRFFDFGKESAKIDWQKDGGYPTHEGNAELIAETKKLIKSLTGLDYKHILITAGATNALNSYLYARKNMTDNEALWVRTHDLYYRMYPQIIRNQDAFHIKSKELKPTQDDVWIVDSPTNPKGQIITGLPPGKTSEEGVVWDAAYHSPTYYKSKVMTYPKHEVMVGSFSKFTSINGIRVGYLATNSDIIYDLAYKYITGDACGVNAIGQILITKFLQNVDLEAFYRAGYLMLEDNRNELSKLSYLFDTNAIPNDGMFAFSQTDAGVLRLLQKASVKVSDGKDLGADYLSIRINLANSREKTSDMVKAVLKADGKG